jgi:hypothetical protein
MLKRPPHLNLYYIFVTSLVFAVSFLVSLFAYVWIPEISFFVFSGGSIFCLTLIVTLLAFRKSKIKSFVFIALVSIVVSTVVYYGAQENISQAICSSFGRTPIRALNSDVVTEQTVLFCGSLGSCDLVDHADGDRYEVCFIQDVRDPSVIGTFVNMRLAQGSDTLVQASHDLNSLRLLDEGSYVIRRGRLTSGEQECDEWVLNAPPSPCILIFGVGVGISE